MRDQCCAPRAEAKCDARDTKRKTLLRTTMVHTVQNSKAVLKVLVVVNATDWKVEKHADKLRQRKVNSVEEDDL